MGFPDPPAVLAADIGTVFGIIFLVIAFLGWLMNVISGQNQPPPPRPRAPGPRRGPRPRDEKLASEIDLFLREVAGQKRQQPEQRRQQPRPEDVPIEVVAEAPPRARPRARPARPRRPQPVVPVQPEIIATNEPGRRPMFESSQRETDEASGSGSSLSEHVGTYMDSKRVEEQVERDLPHSVDNSVQQHLGWFGADIWKVEQAAASSQAAGAIVNLLRDTNGVRQAILINEVLMPPRSRRTGR